ncbi:polysaccharide biosynthesis tyrosine autokinase [Corynebacterium spheniscorum]|uniref:non-specific protein-tyrosine kinase n=1 Tax=Corynebacterium spheniscorum TaxID=185761 RepID=A0A1I2T4Q4_9CORY|nr:polysaccharide biosynthesis tyrosine autokinase [Corynebacterium spheniscorum]KAA8721251.1 polysaccharide biosynthesis tyrosine autokinase [Corynebacterium spheniscorum]SFG60045.1 receptor protein-tyrosine kinase [Corynebacterium spheniscorum]
MNEIATLVTVVTRRWITVLVCALLGLACAIGYAGIRPQEYQSSVTLTVSTTNADGGGNAYQASMAANQRVRTYAAMVAQSDVFNRVAADSEGQLKIGQLRGAVRAMAQADTSLIRITAMDEDPDTAEEMVSLTSIALTDLVAEVETPAGSDVPTAYLYMVGQPSTTDSPVGLKAWEIVALGLFIGLVLGLIAAVIREYYDRTLRTVDDAVDITGAGVLGKIMVAKEIPEPGHQVKTGEANAEAFRHLRTNLAFVAVDHTPRVLLFTSSVPNEGKSFISLNVAAVLAEAGNKVVLVDADLRAGQANASFGTAAHVGLTNVLAGSVEVDDVLQTLNAGVDLLPAGSPPPNPSELLGSQAMSRVLAALKEQYDYVIVDSPPSLPVTDALILAPQVDAVALVARLGLVQTTQLQQSMELLEKTGSQIAGIIVNGLKASKSEGYGYGYGYDSQAEAMVTTAPQKEHSLAQQARNAVHDEAVVRRHRAVATRAQENEVRQTPPVAEFWEAPASAEDLGESFDYPSIDHTIDSGADEPEDGHHARW